MLLDRFIEQPWIKEAWQAVGGGKIVDIRLVDMHRIASYMSKYLTKGVLLASFKARQRRYSTSRDIALVPKGESSGQWAVIKAPLEFLFALTKGILVEASVDWDGVLQHFELSVG